MAGYDFSPQFPRACGAPAMLLVWLTSNVVCSASREFWQDYEVLEKVLWRDPDVDLGETYCNGIFKKAQYIGIQIPPTDLGLDGKEASNKWLDAEFKAAQTSKSCFCLELRSIEYCRKIRDEHQSIDSCGVILAVQTRKILATFPESISFKQYKRIYISKAGLNPALPHSFPLIAVTDSGDRRATMNIPLHKINKAKEIKYSSRIRSNDISTWSNFVVFHWLINYSKYYSRSVAENNSATNVTNFE